VTNADVGVFADIRTRVVDGGERGLLGMAFHPDFRSVPFLHTDERHARIRDQPLSQQHQRDDARHFDG
jgi:hypothetical protein